MSRRLFSGHSWEDRIYSEREEFDEEAYNLVQSVLNGNSIHAQMEEACAGAGYGSRLHMNTTAPTRKDDDFDKKLAANHFADQEVSEKLLLIQMASDPFVQQYGGYHRGYFLFK